MEPTKVRLAVAIGAVVVAATATIFVFTRSTAKPNAKPELMTVPAPPREAPLPEPAEPPPVATAAETVALPAPTARVPDARPSPGQITELLVTSRRIENTDPKRSRELLFWALMADPENPEALERMSRKMVTDEDPKSAHNLVDKCLNAEPRNSECAALKAKLPTDAPTPAAVAQASACLQQNPDAVDCMYTLANNAFYEGKKDGAALLAVSMHRVAPEAAATKLMIGRVRASSGLYAEALRYLAAACELGNKEACFRADLLRNEGW